MKNTKSIAPFIRTNYTMESTMYDVVIALLPVLIVAIYFYGIKVVYILLISILTSLFTEFLITKSFNLENQVLDGSSVVTAMLFCFTLPITIPYHVVIYGSVFSIFIGKMIFGGVGKNPFNPALLGRLYIMISYPQYSYNYGEVDTTIGASIIPQLKYIGSETIFTSFNNKFGFYRDILIGSSKRITSIGEVSILAIIFGMIYLKYKGHIKLRVPLSILGTLSILYIISGKDIIYLSLGGVIFASVYMATDMVSSPYTHNGLILYGVITGVFTYVFRHFTSNPEGITFAILIANILVPTINKHTLSRSFGGEKNMKNIKTIFLIVVVLLLSIIVVNKTDNFIEGIKIKKENSIKQKFIKDIYGENAKISDKLEIKNDFAFTPIEIDNEIVGYITIFESKGYSENMIKFLLALDMEGKIKRLEVLSQNETEGLGSYVASEKWKNLWIGRDSSYIFDKSIDATTGATFTYLNSYKTIIKVLESYDELIGKDSLELENVDFLDLEPIDF